MFSKEEKNSFVKNWQFEIGAEILDLQSTSNGPFTKTGPSKFIELSIQKEVLEEWIRMREFLKAYEE